MLSRSFVELLNEMINIRLRDFRARAQLFYLLGAFFPVACTGEMFAEITWR